MSLGESLNSLASSAARLAARTADAVPVPGVLKGAVRGVARVVSGSGRQHAHEARAEAWSAPASDPVPRPEPTPLRPSVAHEPTASTRAEAHGGSAGRHADDWTDELVEDDGVDEETASAAEPSDEPLISPGEARAVRKEADVMRRGAQPRP